MFWASHQNDPKNRLNRPLSAPCPQQDPKSIGNPFCIVLYIFKNLQKHRFHCKTNDFGMFIASKTFSFLYSFFMFFQHRPWEALLDGPCADLASTGRFWCHFRFSGFPKSKFWGATSRNKIVFELPSGVGVGVLAPTLLFHKP